MKALLKTLTALAVLTMMASCDASAFAAPNAGGNGTSSALVNKGEKGDKGDPGKNGDRGTSIYSGTGAPSNDAASLADYISGDLYIDLNNGKIYRFEIAEDNTRSWKDTNATMKGAKGDAGKNGIDGSDGKDGKDGTSLRTGNTAPAATLGNVGDSYIDYATWDFYVKEASGWVKKGTISAPSNPNPGEGGSEGGDQPGGDQPGGEGGEQGGDQPGGDQPGGEGGEQGGDQPGGEQGGSQEGDPSQETILAKYHFVNESDKTSGDKKDNPDEVLAYFANALSTETDIVTAVSDMEYVYFGVSGGSGDTSYINTDYLKLGKSKGAGKITITLSEAVSEVRILGFAFHEGFYMTVNETEPEEATIHSALLSKDTCDDLENAGLEVYKFATPTNSISILTGNTNTSKNFSTGIAEITFVK